ncbi:MAG: hypothetical protein RIC56_04985 [Pseudomonadales bacterium]
MNLAIRSAILFLLALAAPAFAAHHELPAVADILAQMNHFPSEAQQTTLVAIGQDESVDQDLRTIALAVAHIQHQVPDVYKTQLEAIVADADASDAEKTLAGAALRFNHKATAEDSAALMALTE